MMTKNPSVSLVDYDPKWPERFERERKRIEAALGSAALAMEHFGSTSIPEMAAKPTIDIMLGVKSLAVAESLKAPLAKLGYQFAPELLESMPERRFFGKGPRFSASFHLHAVVWEDDAWEEPLLFRDFLRGHPEEVRRYNALKASLVTTHRGDRNAYARGKEPYIRSIVRRARSELQRSTNPAE